jgi:hypothetical protein
MNLIAIVDDVEQIIETMWGDPNRWDDRQRLIFKVFLTLSNKDRQAGYSLERLDLYEDAVNPGQGSIDKSETNPLAMTRDSLIVIQGPLYRADTFAFREYKLTAKEKPVFAMPFMGYSGPKTIDVEYSDGTVTKDRRRHLPPLSIRTAKHAVAYLPETPVALLASDRSPPADLVMLEELEAKGAGFVRRKYFNP